MITFYLNGKELKLYKNDLSFLKNFKIITIYNDLFINNTTMRDL